MDWTKPPPAVGLLWALHCGQTALAGIRRGDAGRLPAAGGRRRWPRRWSCSPPRGLQTQVDRPGDSGSSGSALGGRRCACHDESSMAGHAQAPAGWSICCMFPWVAAGTLAQRVAGQRLIAIPIVSDRGVLLWRWWWRRAERPPALGQLLLPGAIGEEAVVADAMEAWREHVQQHAADELGRRQRHGLVAAGVQAWRRRRATAAVFGKRYHAPETPCARLLALDAIPVATKDRLRAVLGTVDPLALLDEIRAVQHHLAALAAGATVHPMPERDADLDGFLRSLALAWRAGEVRPTHRARQRPPRHWRTRQDPFETSWPRIVQWLETEPHRTAKELFDRLPREQPGVFLPGQLRTLQRRVRDRRRLAARRLLFVGPTASPLRVADRSRRAERDRDGPGQARPGCRSDSTGRLLRRRPSRTPRITGPGSEPRSGRNGYDLSEASR